MVKGGFLAPCQECTGALQHVLTPERLIEENLKRYIRLDGQDDEVAAEQSGEVPMIDLGKLFDPEFAEDESARTPQVCL